MKQINKWIKKQLKQDSDLIDFKAHIDSKLSYSENKAEIQPLISLLSDTETNHNKLINTTKKAIIETNDHYNQKAFKVALKGFWGGIHKNRYKFK